MLERNCQLSPLVKRETVNLLKIFTGLRVSYFSNIWNIELFLFLSKWWVLFRPNRVVILNLQPYEMPGEAS